MTVWKFRNTEVNINLLKVDSVINAHTKINISKENDCDRVYKPFGHIGT